MFPRDYFYHTLLSLNLHIKSTYRNGSHKLFPSVSSCSCHIRRQIRDPKTADGKVGPSRHRISGTGKLPVSKFLTPSPPESGKILTEKGFPKANVMEEGSEFQVSSRWRHLGGLSAEVGVTYGLLSMLRVPGIHHNHRRWAGKLSS